MVLKMEYLKLIEQTNKLYDSGKYLEALQKIRLARKLEPNDLLVDYSEAGILFAIGQYCQADTIYQNILSMGAEEFTIKSCGRGKSWSDTIILDSSYEQARCKICMGDYITGISLMEKHLSMRRRGLHSEFSKKEVQQDLFIRKIEQRELSEQCFSLSSNARIMSKTQSHRFSSHLHDLQDVGDNSKIKLFLLRKIRLFPDEYYIHILLAETYDVLGKFNKALFHAKAAYSSARYDPLCQYVLAKSLMKQEFFIESLIAANNLLQVDINEIAYGPNGEGMRWAKSIVNDVTFIKAFSLNKLGEKSKAHSLIIEHLSHRKGIYSDFNIVQVKALIKSCENYKNDRTHTKS